MQDHERLIKALGGRPSESLLQCLNDLGFIEEVVSGASTLDDLEREARKVIAAGSEPFEAARSRRPKRRKSGTSRAAALSDLVAHHVRSDPDVVEFRKRHLPEGLLQWSQLVAWVQ